MKYKVDFDKDNYVTNILHTNSIQDIYELNPNLMIMNRLNCYHLVDGLISLDNDKLQQIITQESNAKELVELHKKLDDSDYLVARCFEQVMSLNKPVTFIADMIKILSEFQKKYKTTITNRETWRKRIEEIENANK